jgi:hypothetical protein
MKSVLRTVPKELEMRYDEKFGSETNTEIMRDLIPRLVKSLERFEVTYSQVRVELRILTRDSGTRPEPTRKSGSGQTVDPTRPDPKFLQNPLKLNNSTNIAPIEMILPPLDSS